MERKDLEDLIQRLWDQGASIEIMKILEHDKQQRLTIQYQAMKNANRMLLATELETAQSEFKEALDLLAEAEENLDHKRLLQDRIDSFLVKHNAGARY